MSLRSASRLAPTSTATTTNSAIMTPVIRSRRRANDGPGPRRPVPVMSGNVAKSDRARRDYPGWLTERQQGSIAPDTYSSQSQDGSSPMQSTMQDVPLSLAMLLRHGLAVHGNSEVVTYLGDGSRRATFREVGKRAGRLAHALARLGVTDGD